MRRFRNFLQCRPENRAMTLRLPATKPCCNCCHRTRANSVSAIVVSHQILISARAFSCAANASLSFARTRVAASSCNDRKTAVAFSRVAVFSVRPTFKVRTLRCSGSPISAGEIKAPQCVVRDHFAASQKRANDELRLREIEAPRAFSQAAFQCRKRDAVFSRDPKLLRERRRAVARFASARCYRVPRRAALRRRAPAVRATPRNNGAFCGRRSVSRHSVSGAARREHSQARRAVFLLWEKLRKCQRRNLFQRSCPRFRPRPNRRRPSSWPSPLPRLPSRNSRVARRATASFCALSSPRKKSSAARAPRLSPSCGSRISCARAVAFARHFPFARSRRARNPPQHPRRESVHLPASTRCAMKLRSTRRASLHAKLRVGCHRYHRDS